MPHKRTFAVELIKVEENSQRQIKLMGFVPHELEEWDYTDPRSGVVRVQKMRNGRFWFTPVEGAAAEILKGRDSSNRVVLQKELRRAFDES